MTILERYGKLKLKVEKRREDFLKFMEFVETKTEYLTAPASTDVDGKKDILGLWIQETESKHFWIHIFDEIKSRGVQEIGFMCMDGRT